MNDITRTSKEQVSDATLTMEINSYAGEKSIHAREVHALLCELRDVRKALREAGYLGSDSAAGIRGLRLLFDAERAENEPAAAHYDDVLARRTLGEVGSCDECSASFYNSGDIGKPCTCHYCRGTVRASVPPWEAPGCDCPGIRKPDTSAHAANCPYRVIREIDRAAQPPSALQAEVERMRKLFWLAKEDVIFFSGYDAKTDTWPDIGEYWSPCVNLNDTFAYACADGERLDDSEIDRLIAAHKQWGYDGVVAWASLIRKCEPIEPRRTAEYHEARSALTKEVKP